jgi:chromate transport protein ChrA
LTSRIIFVAVAAVLVAFSGVRYGDWVRSGTHLAIALIVMAIVAAIVWAARNRKNAYRHIFWSRWLVVCGVAVMFLATVGQRA